MKKELKGFQEGPEADTHLDSLRTTLKKETNQKKMPGHGCVRGFLFKKLMSIHDKLALQLNKCQEEPTCLPMMWKILTKQI